MDGSDEKESTKTTTVHKLEIEEDIEGEHVATNDYFFNKIGKPIPIVPNSSPFDLHSPPSRPLALSDLHRVIFLAHSSGFLVARTKDVMDASRDSSSSCIQHLCVVDVPIGKVDSLSLSADSATLAACVAFKIHFFSVNSLLNKDSKPSSSCSLTETNTVKDMLWTRRSSDNSYLVLSKNAELYHGSLASQPLKRVMEKVDAVEWSVKGNFFAVARENFITILSSKFKERSCIYLPFKSWLADSDDGCTVKVDSIRWICCDTIVVGSLQQTVDGREENYLVQVIRSEDGKFTDISSKPVVLSFYDLFSGLTDDIMPYGTGPYLLLSYLQQCGLAVVANRKNVDQHVVLLGWSIEDDINEITAIDIERDDWLPRIELQGNGDDNLIMGMCIDKVTVDEKFKVEVGVEEQKELSPFCVLMCVTLEGKLVIFHVASVSGDFVPHNGDSSHKDEEEEDSHGEILSGSYHSNLSSRLTEERLDQVALGLQLQNGHEKQSNDTKGGEVPTKTDLLPSDATKTSTTTFSTDQISFRYPVTKNKEVETLENFNPSVIGGQQKISATNLHQEIDDQQIKRFGQESAQFGLFSLKNSTTERPGFLVTDSSKPESNKFTGFGYVPSFIPGVVPANDISLVKSKDMQKSGKLYEESPAKNSSAALQDALSQSRSSGRVISSDGPGGGSSIPSSLIAGNMFENASGTVGVSNVPNDLVQKPFLLKDNSAELSLAGSSVRPLPIGGRRTSTAVAQIESLPSMHISQFLPQEDFVSGRAANHRPYFVKDERSLPKQPGNIKEMVKELDELLDSITKTGGFRDDCTVSLRSSIEALEEGMRDLSERCSLWKGLIDEQLEGIQHLLDKTVQVLARKMHIEGIVKQASDRQYWEFWNCQKLSPELELKRQRILKLNQVLTNQLIELERHFHTLEIQRSGESGFVHGGRRAIQNRYAPSRNIQSLHSLHNTMSLQLVAAEQLSECLSKQMAVLSVDSPVKQSNVKKELFETIGISYDASFSSPVATKIGDTSSVKQLLLSSGSAATKHQSTRRQSSATVNSDSETSRRRRDSLDKSWASFEPTKTTVKRMLLQDQKTSAKKSPLLMGRNHFGPSIPEGSAVTQDQTSPSNSWFSSSNKGIEHKLEKVDEKKLTQFRQVNYSPVPSRPSDLRSPILQTNDAVFSSVSASRILSILDQNHAGANVASDNSRSGISYRKRSDSVFATEPKPIQPSETSIHQRSSFSPGLSSQSPFLLKKANEKPDSHNEGTVPTNSTSESLKSGITGTKSSSSESLDKVFNSTFPPVVGSSVLLTQPGIVSPFNFATGKSQPGEKASSSQALSTSHPVSSQVINTSSSLSGSPSSGLNFSAAMPFGKSFTSPFATTNDIQTDSSNSLSFSPLQASTSASVTLHDAKNLPSFTAPSVLEPPKKEVEHTLGKTTSVDPTISPLVSESLKTELLSPADKPLPSVEQTPSPSSSGPLPTEKVNVDSTGSLSEPEPPAFNLKLEPSVQSVSTTEILTGLSSGSRSSFSDMVSLASNVPLSAQPEQKSTAQVLFGTALSTSKGTTSGKNDTLDVTVTEEDEMEEEAPAASHSNDLSLGSLGGFGIGSSPNPTTARANPFGIVGTNQSTSPFTMTIPSGELFRPASLNFQSPQPSQSSPPFNLGAMSGAFGSGTGVQAPTQGQFGQPAQIGAGQQALGSVLGAFGQSRQIGAGLPGGTFSGFSSASPGGGFGGAATPGGGFAAAGSPGGGFAAAASGGGGFAAAASGGGGFAASASGGGGFAAAASTGGGFGAAAPTGGGFGGSAPTGGGFGGAAPTGGGFGGAAPTGGGFGGSAPTAGGFGGAAPFGGGFGGAAPTAGGFGGGGGGGFGGLASGSGEGFSGAVMGGGFGGSTPSDGFGGGFVGFGSQQGAGFGGNMGGGGTQQGGGGFSAFGGGGGNTGGTPPGFFTQIRK